MVVQEKQCCHWRLLGLGLLPTAARAWVSTDNSKASLFLPFSLSWVGFFCYCIIDGQEKDDLQREGDSGGTVVVLVIEKNVRDF